MHPLIHLTYYHHANTSVWITHLIVSSLVHGLIYSAIFRLMRGMSPVEVLLLVGVVIGGLYLWAQRRDRRDW